MNAAVALIPTPKADNSACLYCHPVKLIDESFVFHFFLAVYPAIFIRIHSDSFPKE